MEPEAVNNLIQTINTIPLDEGIVIDFSSDGGQIQAAQRLGEVIWKNRERVRMHNTGRVASAAILPYLVADERRASPDATFFYHPIMTGIRGVPLEEEQQVLWFSKATLQDGVDRISRDETMYADLHDSRTNVPRGTVRSLLRSDNTKDAQWAFFHGVAHNIEDFELPEGVFICVVSSNDDADDLP